MRWYKHLTYSSDAFIEAYGRSLEEAFVNAARAMMSVMIDVRRVSSKAVRDSVDLEGFDLENLLYNWLEAVLNKFVIEKKVFSRYSVEINKEDGGYRLRATLKGEVYDPSKHGRRREVKGVTYHEMRIARRGDGLYVVRFLLDL